MRTGMMALAVGLLVPVFLPVLPPVGLMMLLPLVGLVLLPFRSYPVALLLFGFTWACVSAQGALNDRLPAALDGETRWVEGRVVGLPRRCRTVQGTATVTGAPAAIRRWGSGRVVGDQGDSGTKSCWAWKRAISRAGGTMPVKICT